MGVEAEQMHVFRVLMCGVLPCCYGGEAGIFGCLYKLATFAFRGADLFTSATMKVGVQGRGYLERTLPAAVSSIS